MSMSPMVENGDNDRAMRPRSFDEYIGQKQLVNKLKIAIESSRKRNEPVDHILLGGGAGLGKTTIAYLVANSLSDEPRCIAAPSISSLGDLIEILTGLTHQSVLFLDEIHALSKKLEEHFYSAMEDFKIDIKTNKKIITFKLPRFTLIGATTKPGMLLKPMYDRFGIIHTMDFYSIEELTDIADLATRKLDISCSKNVLISISQRSRGVPRVCNRLMRRLRDYHLVYSNGQISMDSVIKSMEIEGVDENGLTQTDKKYLNIIIDIYNGGPVGINAIIASMGEDKRTIEEVVEPFLLRMGYVARDLRGRIITEKGESVVKNSQE